MRSNYTTTDDVDVELDGIERDGHHRWTRAHVYGCRECPARPGEWLGTVERVRTRFRFALAASVRAGVYGDDTYPDFDAALVALVDAAYPTDSEIAWSGP